MLMLMRLRAGLIHETGCEQVELSPMPLPMPTRPRPRVDLNHETGREGWVVVSRKAWVAAPSADVRPGGLRVGGGVLVVVEPCVVVDVVVAVVVLGGVQTRGARAGRRTWLEGGLEWRT